MTDFSIYHVNAFTTTAFTGNPAAVVPLNFWLDDATLQLIAAQNNLSETSFFVKTLSGFNIRWFTPKVEVKLCGHATLAAAYVIFEELGYNSDTIIFESKSGELSVSKSGNKLFLDFPAASFEIVPEANDLVFAIGATPEYIFKAEDDYMLVFESKSQIEEISPDFGLLTNVKARGIIVTAISDEENIDFVSRFFGPASGVNEDPVTGSAHTKLIPYWAKRLSKNKMVAKQISKRGGLLFCELKGERVSIGGEAQLYLKGKIWV